MCGNDLGKKLITFSLTFAIGFSISNFFNFESPKPEVEKIEQVPNVSVRENESKSVSQKPLCKRYDSDFYIELIQKRAELKTLLEKPSITSQEKKHYQQEIDKLAKKIDELKQKEKEPRNLAKEPKVSHNLLYVEKCIEY